MECLPNEILNIISEYSDGFGQIGYIKKDLYQYKYIKHLNLYFFDFCTVYDLFMTHKIYILNPNKNQLMEDWYRITTNIPEPMYDYNKLLKESFFYHNLLQENVDEIIKAFNTNKIIDDKILLKYSSNINSENHKPFQT